MLRLPRIADLLADLRAQRLRWTLSVMGIVWGTVAVVVLLAFGTGVERQVRTELGGMGDGIVIVFGGRTSMPFAGFGERRPIRLREEDATLLARDVAGIEAVTYEYGPRPATTSRGDREASPHITGIEPVYARLRNIEVASGGRFLNAPDMERRRRVAVLGREVHEALFGTAEPAGALGEEILIGGVPFRVVGVMEPKSQASFYSARDGDRIFIPSTTYRTLFTANVVNNLIYRPVDARESEAVRASVYETLGRRHRFDPADRQALNVWDTTEMFGQIGYFFMGLKIFLAVVGSFTLTVGGVGVANIMFIVVRERASEIGVRRSVGARRRDILFQFLGESAVVVGFGAALGLLISLGLIGLVGLLPLPDELGRPIFSGSVAAVTILLLGVVAGLAGYFPARRAARLDPMDCLRHGGL